MSTEKWVAGTSPGLTWTDAFASATLNSITAGNAILSNIQIDNSSNLDIFCDVTCLLGSITPASGGFIGIYLYALNGNGSGGDGTTYGDGRFTTQAVGPPPGNYYRGSFGLPTATSTQSGSVVGIIMPPGKFKFVLYNGAGVNLAASGNTLQYRTYDRSIA